MIVWTIEHDRSFRQLKSDLVSVPVLWNPDFTLTLNLQTDASDRGPVRQEKIVFVDKVVVFKMKKSVYLSLNDQSKLES